MQHGTGEVAITSFDQGRPSCGIDTLVIEEPLETRLAYYRDGALHHYSLAVTLRTPGDDIDLVRGFLFSEGIIARAADILSVNHVGSDAARLGSSNVVQVKLAPHLAIDVDKLKRHFPASSACGVCGKASLEQLENAGVEPVIEVGFALRESAVRAIPGAARKLQGIFDETGAAHSAAAFNHRGEVFALREDIGRHNALDKLIGALLQQNGCDFSRIGVFVSSRASFELLQKSAKAGFPIFIAVGAPSTLAVEVAREFDITLLGFVRQNRFNIYNRADRVTTSAGAFQDD